MEERSASKRKSTAYADNFQNVILLRPAGALYPGVGNHDQIKLLELKNITDLSSLRQLVFHKEEEQKSGPHIQPEFQSVLDMLCDPSLESEETIIQFKGSPLMSKFQAKDLKVSRYALR